MDLYVVEYTTRFLDEYYEGYKLFVANNKQEVRDKFEKYENSVSGWVVGYKIKKLNKVDGHYINFKEND